jgi:hypothetical protein
LNRGSATANCQSATFFIAAEIASGLISAERFVASGPGSSGASPAATRSSGSTRDLAGACATSGTQAAANHALSKSMPIKFAQRTLRVNRNVDFLKETIVRSIKTDLRSKQPSISAEV